MILKEKALVLLELVISQEANSQIEKSLAERLCLLGQAWDGSYSLLVG